MKKIIVIHDDVDNSIILCKDHYHGIVVQVLRKVDQLVPTFDGVENIRKVNVVHQEIVKVSSDFRAGVDKAIVGAKAFLEHVLKQDAEINGLLNDYLSSHKDLNESADQ